VGALTCLEVEGFKEKVLRRTRSKSTLDIYLRGVARLAQFGRTRLGSDRDDARVLQAIIDDLSSRDWRDDAVYSMLDRFVGWALSPNDGRGDPSKRGRLWIRVPPNHCEVLLGGRTWEPLD
jgi:hypothetical protein